MEELSSPQVSPPPFKKTSTPVLLKFPDAVKAVIEGKRITRIDWNDVNVYGLLKDGYLMIYMDNKFHQWIVSDGDMLAEDWTVISEEN